MLFLLDCVVDIKKLPLLLENFNIAKPSSNNQRVYADMLEVSACAIACQLFPAEYRKARSVKSTEDFALESGNKTIYIDVKTRQLNADLNMPNMISVDKLNKLLDNPDTELYYWMIDYRVKDDGSAVVEHNEIRAVWTLPWNALSIQNLGLGQLQISDWSAINDSSFPRDVWHIMLKERMRSFYSRQAEKFLQLAKKV